MCIVASLPMHWRHRDERRGMALDATAPPNDLWRNRRVLRLGFIEAVARKYFSVLVDKCQ
jgi:hypothetical protein